MKRMLLLTLVFVMVLSLVSCASETSVELQIPVLQNELDAVVLEDEPEKVKAGIFWYDFADAFLSKVRDALNTELDALGVEYENYDAAQTQAKQNEQIDEAIADGANLLIVNIVETADVDNEQAITDKAREADIPIIFFNREVADDVINSYENVCYVGTRSSDLGKAQGEMAGEYIAANYEAIDLNGDGKISYILMHGGLCCGEPQVRAESVNYANKILIDAGYSGLTYYDDENIDKFNICSWSKDTAFETMEIALTEHSIEKNNMIEAVFSGNDDMAIGCIEALTDVGWNTGREGEPSIPVFGIDCTDYARMLIEADMMTGTVTWSANTYSDAIIFLVNNVIEGKYVFEGADERFYVDHPNEYNTNRSAKIRVSCDKYLREDIYVNVLYQGYMSDELYTMIRNALI